MKIVLTGYMGSGKSTIAQRLALDTGLQLLDIDKEIEKHTGETISEIISSKGELYFRKMERQKLEELLTRENFVLSTGGGTPCYYDNIDLINRQSVSIYLRYGVKELFERLKNDKQNRPLIARLEGDGLMEFIGKHLFERAPFYEKSTFMIAGAGHTETEIINEIKDLTNE